VVTTPDRHYDICVEGTCVSPGCGDATCNVPGPHFPLADTDQRLCYDDSAQIACPASGTAFFGQDAEYGWDTLHAESERFTGDTSTANQPVVIDNVTGLVWQGCAAGLTRNACDSGLAAKYSWQDALAYCDGLNWGGQQDWHLPDPYELHSIVDLGTASPPKIDTTAFPATPSNLFWSSSSVGPGFAWYVDFDLYLGYVGNRSAGGNYYVRCVRSGPGSWAQSQRFSRNTSVMDQPVVVDNVTGLSWQGCAAGLTGNACGPGTAATYAWANALGYCTGLDWGGHQDWRLPDAKELHSIVNQRTTRPAIDTTAFPATPSDSFWSSSSQADKPGVAWVVDHNGGSVGTLGKVFVDAYLRCVRTEP